MISESNYRLTPPLAHRDYIVLTDLLEWLCGVVSVTAGPVLDFGCGDSPYRPLFGDRPYARADIAGASQTDFTIAPDETIPAPTNAYGTVLSTQVLEHVDRFREYLAECHRILQPGGHLLISTHGFFEEHGHPNDFLTGLAAELERTGFSISSADKLTVGPRALHYLMGSQIWKTNPSRKNILGFGLSLLRKTILQRPEKWNAFADKHYNQHRRQTGLQSTESLFIGIAFAARRL
jgi:SAM-dependent methyltransferase